MAVTTGLPWSGAAAWIGQLERTSRSGPSKRIICTPTLDRITSSATPPARTISSTSLALTSPSAASEKRLEYDSPSLGGMCMFRMPHRFLVGLMCASFLVAPAASNGAELKDETLKAWDAYIQTANSQMGDRLHGHFLWVDEEPDRAARVRAGEILVSSVGQKIPK